MYQTTARHNPQDRNNIQKHRCKDLNSHSPVMFTVATGLQCFLNWFHNFNLNRSDSVYAAL